MQELIPVAIAAKKIGCHPAYLRKRCADGTVPAVLIGTEYRVQWEDVLAWVRRKPSRQEKVPTATGEDLLALIESWESYLSHVRAFSPRTLDLYQMLIRKYIKRMAAIGQSALSYHDLFERKTVMAVFEKIPARSYSTKMNTYLMLRSFGTFLMEEGKLTPDVLEALKPLKPRRQVEPKRINLKAEEVDRLFDLILTRANPVADNLTFATMVACMVYAGLRVTEVCNLAPRDVDLDERVLTVIHGKGGKNRRVGISTALYSYLEEYQRVHRPRGDRYFLRADGSRWNKSHVAKRLKYLTRRHGIEVTAHALRRTFATLAAANGRSVNYLRLALGHSHLSTTQAYLRTSEAEVVEAMKGW